MSEYAYTLCSTRIGFDDIGLVRAIALIISWGIGCKCLFMNWGERRHQHESPRRVFDALLKVLGLIVCVAIFIWYCLGMPIDNKIFDYLGLGIVFFIPVCMCLRSLLVCCKVVD